MNTQDKEYVRSVLAGTVANCVPDGALEPPAGARCKTRAGFRAWLRRAEVARAPACYRCCGTGRVWGIITHQVTKCVSCDGTGHRTRTK